VVDRAVESLKRNGYRSHALLWEIVNSAPFRYRPGLTKKGMEP